MVLPNMHIQRDSQRQPARAILINPRTRCRCRRTRRRRTAWPSCRQGVFTVADTRRYNEWVGVIGGMAPKYSAERTDGSGHEHFRIGYRPPGSPGGVGLAIQR